MAFAARWEADVSASLFSASVIPVVEQAVKFGQARHNVLAGNIANIDTPGYRARDLSVEVFQPRLQEAIQVKNSPESPGMSAGMSDGDATSETLRMPDAFQTI